MQRLTAEPASATALEDHPPLAGDVEARRVVDAVLAGDRDAFRALVERESRAVFRICYRILRNPDDAQEASQEAFVSAFRSLPAWREDGPFGAWIARIALHVALRRSRHPSAVAWIDPIDPESLGDESVAGGGWVAGQRRLVRELRAAAAMAAPRTDPALLAVGAERAEAVRIAVAALDEPYREAVALRFFGELTVPEIAAVTGRPDGTIKTHLHRGLIRLRRSLEQAGNAS